MTPKEKAKELIDKFQSRIKEYPSEIYEDDIEFQTARQCALVAVDEIIKSNPVTEQGSVFVRNFLYWESVKEQLNKI